jgi:hypothetical protein
MKKRKGEKNVSRKGAQSVMFLTAALVITVVSFMFPAAVTFGGYGGIVYHGFPVGWMGETTRGIASITNAYTSLQYENYLLGYFVDIIFWFFVAFLLMVIPLEMKK